MFPFNATPTGKPRSTELMSRSLAPQYDGLSYGLIRSQIFGDYNRNFVNDMSRSLAICNLKDNGVNNTTNLPTVEEVLYEETPPPPSPPPTLSPKRSKQINGTMINENDNRSANNDGLLKVKCIFGLFFYIKFLLKEYQKSRAEITKQFDEHEIRRNELQKQLSKN
jgi:hypothetical protein